MRIPGKGKICQKCHTDTQVEHRLKITRVMYNCHLYNVSHASMSNITITYVNQFKWTMVVHDIYTKQVWNLTGEYMYCCSTCKSTDERIRQKRC